jgi:hypothetical protein
LGLFNSGGTRISADNLGVQPATGEFNSDTGYGLFINSPNTTSAAGANIRARNITNNSFFNTSAFTNLSGSGSTTALVDSTTYQMTFSVVKTSASLMTISAEIADLSNVSFLSFSTTDSTSLYDSFDMISVFSNPNLTTSLNIDDVSVTYTPTSVPEPNVGFALLAVFIWGWVYVSKRSKPKRI